MQQKEVEEGLLEQAMEAGFGLGVPAAQDLGDAEIRVEDEGDGEERDFTSDDSAVRSGSATTIHSFGPALGVSQTRVFYIIEPAAFNNMSCRSWLAWSIFKW
tara:strand:- start:126 stop:431 length:306 start_codon:yes stop_codon:yes gene_type:complete